LKRGKHMYVNDSVLRKLIKRISRKAYVKVGVLSGSGDTGDGMSMATLAAIHEFGTKHVPERSFIRTSFSPVSSEQSIVQQKLAKKIYGGMQVSTALALLGTWGADHVQKRISNQEIKQDLAPSTIARKAKINVKNDASTSGNANTALVETGRLRQSINYKVVG